MRYLIVILFVAAFNLGYFSQTKHQLDTESIKGMCGCFEVDFNFIETFNYSKDSTYIPSKEKHMKALEWAQLVQDDTDKIVIQHLLVVGDKENQFVIKHWRQDWIYENTNFYFYNHDNKWDYKQLEEDLVKGQWTQKVFQVDDSPRYEGSATWVHVDGKHYWENTTDAPLPRREYTTRSDYNLTVRNNRHEIVNKGWIHDQYNKKIVRTKDSTDFVLAEEKGVNNYNRVVDEKCKKAIDWWSENQDYWSNVRNIWSEIYSRNTNLELHEKVEGKRIYDVLFGMDIKSSNKKIKKSILPYVIVN